MIKYSCDLVATNIYNIESTEFNEMRIFSLWYWYIEQEKYAVYD